MSIIGGTQHLQETAIAMPGDAVAARTTGHLKAVPQQRPVRQQIRSLCEDVARRMDKTHAVTKAQLERISRGILQRLGLPEAFTGWTMVILASEFWREQVAAIPVSRRLLLLPHCLKHSRGCPAEFDERGLECVKCGACNIADFRDVSESMGYRVLVAEGSPLVLRIIVSGHVDAIVGVACLNVLEKAIDKILLAGIPCMAVPLLSSECRNTSVDEDWVHEMIHAVGPDARSQTRSYVHLMRCASGMFASDEIERLIPRIRGGPRLSQINGDGLSAIEPIAGTESIAYDFLQKGGKYARPFITLAVYDALTGGHGTMPDGARWVARLPDAVKRAAMSIETFHKASLVHDDIEDDDPFRYGEATMHRQYGTATAINVGDYLIGMGYRMISRETRALGADVAVDILDCLATAHTKLSEGQGAELLWRDSRNKRLKPIDALKIYALKTAPAFEAALFAGIRLAGPVGPYGQPIKVFARNLGVAFQILNDLNDWRGDQHNKLTAGADLLAGRPTILWALALESLDDRSVDELLNLVKDDRQPFERRLQRAWDLYDQAGAFEKANRLIEKHQQRCQEVAEKMEPEAFGRLLQYLIAAVLERPDE